MEYSPEHIEKVIANVRKGKMPVPDNMDKATAALFWEKRHTSMTEERGLTPLYNLGTRDHDGTLSMYQIYMQCTTEYEAAVVLLGSLRHWSMLLECKWFKPHIEQWRKDMALRDEAIGRRALILAASDGIHAAGNALLRDAGKRGAKPMNPKERGDGTQPARSPKVVSAAKEQLLEQAAKLAEKNQSGRGK
jgi:hypothetical protein